MCFTATYCMTHTSSRVFTLISLPIQSFANQNQIDRYGPPEIRKQTISVWSNWADAECSVTCGGGSKTQTRTCINGNVGDVGCEGSENQDVSCNDQDCPGNNLNHTLCFISRALKCQNNKKIITKSHNKINCRGMGQSPRNPSLSTQIHQLKTNYFSLE